MLPIKSIYLTKVQVDLISWMFVMIFFELLGTNLKNDNLRSCNHMNDINGMGFFANGDASLSCLWIAVNSKMRLVRSLHKTVKTIKAIKTVKTDKTIKAIKIVKTIKKESIYISVQHFQNTVVSNMCNCWPTKGLSEMLFKCTFQKKTLLLPSWKF